MVSKNITIIGDRSKPASLAYVVLLGLISSLWADCRWINEGETHLWSDPANWKDGRIPTSEDAFLSTPYYVDLSTWRWDYTDPEWLTYENPDHRCAIQDGIDAVCKKAKNMRQIYIDITGGSLNILNEWKIGQDDGPGVIVNISGGVVNVGTFMDLCGWSENYSMGTLNMSGGTVNIAQNSRMGMWTTSHSYLNGNIKIDIPWLCLFNWHLCSRIFSFRGRLVMRRIISVSRRTDIPAFYGDWFMRRLKEGFAGVANPFGGRKYIVSLKPEDVVCFVFWSKNFRPFLENLKIIDGLGYKFYFNYTVTALPDTFESNVEKQSAIETLKLLSRIYTPRHINWRFDPIIISGVLNRDFYIKAFEKLASEFDGFVERCYFSFVTEYNKVKRNFEELERAKGVKITDCSVDFKVELANELAAIAEHHGIQMFSCCGDYLVNDSIKKAHCIDGGIIGELFFPEDFSYNHKPTRKECGCTESTDIGTYDTCPHGCVYCYANVNKHRAYKAFRNHDEDSAFLGYSKSQSDRWLAEIQNTRIKRDSEYLEMF